MLKYDLLLSYKGNPFTILKKSVQKHNLLACLAEFAALWSIHRHLKATPFCWSVIVFFFNQSINISWKQLAFAGLLTWYQPKWKIDDNKQNSQRGSGKAGGVSEKGKKNYWRLKRKRLRLKIHLMNLINEFMKVEVKGSERRSYVGLYQKFEAAWVSFIVW